MKLFEVKKVGLYLDTITHSTETRHDTEVKIVTLALRVQPFDSRLASAMADGVRTTLFKLNTADPKDTLRRVDFTLGTPRQQLHVFAAPDTPKASIVFDQAKIFHTYARTEKAVAGYGFVFKASFGPCGRQELEYIQDWHLGQRFVTFEEAEPGLFDDGDGDEEPEPVAEPGLLDDPRDDQPAASSFKPLQDLLGKAGAVIALPAIAAWSSDECDSASEWAKAQIAAHQHDKPGHHTSVKWPDHVAAASRESGREEVRHRLHSHQSKRSARKKTAKKGRR